MTALLDIKTDILAYTKLYAFTSAKTLECEMCHDLILPFTAALEGEESGLYHEACILEKFTGIYPLFLLGQMQGTCSKCNQSILVLGAWDTFDHATYHEDCVSIPVDRGEWRRETVPYIPGPAPEPVQPSRPLIEVLIDSAREEEKPAVPDGRYLVDGWYVTVRTEKEGGYFDAGTRILSLAKSSKEKPKQVGFVNDTWFNVWRSKADVYPEGQPVAKKLLRSGRLQEYLIAYGKKTGVCGVCGRELTDEESKARGIGPICAGKL